MIGRNSFRIQHKGFLILQLVFLTKYCIAFRSDKVTDINPEKYEDLYDEDKLQNIVWMNMFGSYPTVTDSSKSRMVNSTYDYDYSNNDKNNENLKVPNDQEIINVEDKSVEMNKNSKLGSKSAATNTEKTILEMLEDSPLYQLCLRTVNVVETCLAFMLKSNNIRKIYVDKQHICTNLPTWIEFRQCLQKSGEKSINKFLENNILMSMVKKNKKTADTPKRLPFHAWGGKRFNQVGTEKVQTSRVPFNAWGGKRQVVYNGNGQRQPTDLYQESCEPCKRSKFHSWGGKRNKRKATV